jgi:hypothetical protein
MCLEACIVFSCGRGVGMLHGFAEFLWRGWWIYSWEPAVFHGEPQYLKRAGFRYPAPLDFGWTFKGVNIYNCSVGIDVSAATSGKQQVGSVTSIDSSITNTPIGVPTGHSSTSQPATGGSLIVETVAPSNVPLATEGASGTILTGRGTSNIRALTQGHRYSACQHHPQSPSSMSTSSPCTKPSR